jgi:hypothetical protein
MATLNPMMVSRAQFRNLTTPKIVKKHKIPNRKRPDAIAIDSPDHTVIVIRITILPRMLQNAHEPVRKQITTSPSGKATRSRVLCKRRFQRKLGVIDVVLQDHW